MFNAASALNSADYSLRVQRSIDQHRLDISEKERSSVLPWRGQFSPQLIDYLMERHAPRHGLVADPFCGSGTVLYEAAAHGLDGFACDINPGAICLAEFSAVCAIDLNKRVELVDTLTSFARRLTDLASSDETGLYVDEAASLFWNQGYSDLASKIVKPLLLISAGNNNKISAKKIKNGQEFIKKSILSVPFSNSKLVVGIEDARELSAASEAVDYIVTSPPYINVFNYHQNYRPILEALGDRPLKIARAELGANRKFRQNRYMTAVQYCMDMALYLIEAARILKPNGYMTIILGRESNIRGVSLKNGELIAAIAAEGLGGDITDWHERNFMNRFGETIYEDVLTIRPKYRKPEEAIEIGRLVGIEALRRALNYCPDERRSEIEDAMASGPSIECSPFIIGKHLLDD